MIDDLAALLWCINLGCIDLNQWYARCDDVDRPDYLHFDLDPVGEVEFATVREAAGVVNETLQALGMPTWVKTTGSRGIHVYVPIVRGPTQKQVWEVSKTIALDVARRHGRLLTAVYKKAARPQGRVLVDYNQNAWGRTLASVYSVRPRPRATVSDPGHLGRGRARLRDRRLPHRQPPRPPQEARRPLVPPQHRQSPLRPHPPRLNLRTRLTSSTRASAGGVGARRGWRASQGPRPQPWHRPATRHRTRADPAALAHYTMATASISIIQSGWARAGIATSVEAGPFLPKNSSRTGTRSAR